MNRRIKPFALLGMFAVVALFVGVLFGTVSAAPAATGELSVLNVDRASAAIAPSSQVTGSVDVNVQTQPQGQTGEGGGATTTTQTTNVGINVPWWVWLVGLLLLVLIVALVAGNRGGNTTVIKD